MMQETARKKEIKNVAALLEMDNEMEDIGYWPLLKVLIEIRLDLTIDNPEAGNNMIFRGIGLREEIERPNEENHETNKQQKMDLKRPRPPDEDSDDDAKR